MCIYIFTSRYTPDRLHLGEKNYILPLLYAWKIYPLFLVTKPELVIGRLIIQKKIPKNEMNMEKHLREFFSNIKDT